MKNEFTTCDRCGANAPSVNQIKAFEIQMVYDHGTSTPRPLETLDICHVCANSFVHWFGKMNPLTGLEFETYHD